MTLKDPRILAVTATSLLVLVVAFLATQHVRHGWPFSLHHGIGVAPPPVRIAPTDGGTTSPTHPRAEVQLDPAQVASIGVRLEKVRKETSSQPLRAVATVVPDESRVSHVHPRVAGWIERLYVTTTGEKVEAGQALAGIFSQELLSTQNEYLAARRAEAEGPRSAIVEGARSRLQVLGMTDAEIRAIEQAGQPKRLVTVAAPRSGVVLNRGISVGTAVDPSTEIVTVADLTRVWVLAEVPEGDIPSAQVATWATLAFPASGTAPFDHRVAFLYPTLSERTRTLRVRFEVENPSGALRPGLYGSATFHASARQALTIPRDAVVDTGASQHVFVVAGEQRFAPRAVKLGTRFGDRVEVLEGLGEGESIVAAGVFLLDSESRLRASGGGTGHQHGSAPEDRGHEGHSPSPPSSPARGHEGHSPPPSTPARDEEHPPLPPSSPARGHEGHSPSRPSTPVRGHEGH
jgi:Cu(I)/Ag(I) efflux system membrane fusion protein